MPPPDAYKPPLSPQPIVIFAGPFGSGKTEVAVNYALAAARDGARLFLVDMDIVTPYFRVGDLREELEAHGVRVIAPPGALASFENPALPPEVGSALAGSEGQAVLDVGGDAVGARLLNAYAATIRRRGYDMWVVVNPFRYGSAPDQAVTQAADIEAMSGLSPTGVVANPHVGRETRPEDVKRGIAEARDAAERLDLPLAFAGVERSLLARLDLHELPALPLDLMVRLPWELRGAEE